MRDSELLTLKYKAAAFDAFVEKFQQDSRYVGVRHIPRRFQKSANVLDYDSAIETRYTWEFSFRFDCENPNERPNLEDALFAMIPPLARWALKQQN